MKACLLIPVYDHGSEMEGLLESLESLGLPCIVVDDGSHRETREELERVAERFDWVSLLRHTENRGKGAALKTGFTHAHATGHTHSLQLDADGQHAAADVRVLWEAARSQPDSLILGQPTLENAPWSRIFGRRVSQFWTGVETCSREIADPLCGLRCMPLEATLQVLDGATCGNRMEFDPEIAVRLVWKGVSVVNVPCRVCYLDGGTSHFDILWDNLRISWMHTRLFFGMLIRFPRLVRASRARMAGTPEWHARPERGALLGMRIMVWIYRHIGAGIARLLLFPIIAYFFAMGPASRRASLDYLYTLYDAPGGREALGHKPGWGMVFRHFLEFGLVILDRVGFWLGRREDFEIEIRGMEHLDRVAREGRGALILGSHLGSFDAMQVVAQLRSPISVNVLMYTRNAPYINSILRGLESDNGNRIKVRVLEIVPGSFSHVLEAKACIERGELLGVLADRRHPNERGRAAPVEFLGRQTQLPQGPILLAAALRCPVLFMVGLRMGRGRYRIDVEPFADPVHVSRPRRSEQVAEYCQTFADRLAYHCRRAPLQWFNFYEFWEGRERGHEH